jgi:hypothetical protein
MLRRRRVRERYAKPVQIQRRQEDDESHDAQNRRQRLSAFVKKRHPQRCREQNLDLPACKLEPDQLPSRDRRGKQKRDLGGGKGERGFVGTEHPGPSEIQQNQQRNEGADLW